jgi:hypothetical protein
MDKGRKNLEEILGAMETNEKWDKFVAAKNEVFTGKIDKEKASKFADYLTKRFIDACNDKTVFGSFQNWQLKSTEEKTSITEKLLAAFINNIKDDIINDKVTLHTRDGNEFHTDNPDIAKQYKEDIISSIPKITVKHRDASGAMMGVARENILYINFDFTFYKFNTPEFFLMDLKHEFTHIIDMFIPEISHIDQDTILDAQMFYVNPITGDPELYENNPLELNANQNRKDLRIKIEQMLNAQSTFINDKSKTL